MQRKQTTVSNLIERKAVYQKHRLIATLVSGLIVLAAVLLFIPHEETVVINTQSILPFDWSGKGNGGAENRDRTTSKTKQRVDIPARSIIPARQYRTVPDIHENPYENTLFVSTHGYFAPVPNYAVGFPGSGGSLASVTQYPYRYDPWPLKNTRSDISALNSYDPDLFYAFKAYRGGISSPIKILFPNSARILPPRETMNIIDTARFKIKLTVRENGTIPGDGIQLISMFPTNIPDRYLSLYRENIQNLLRTEAVIEPAKRSGNDITDSTYLSIVYLKGGGGLSASNTGNVQIIY